MRSNAKKFVCKEIFKFYESFIKIYNEKSDKGCFLEGVVQYSKYLHNLHNNLLLVSERMKIEKKVEKLVANLSDKAEYVMHIRNLKQALNHGLVLKKVHRIIKFKQKFWLKSCIDMNPHLRKSLKNDF